MANSIAQKVTPIVGNRVATVYNLLEGNLDDLSVEARFRPIFNSGTKVLSIAHINFLYGDPVVISLPQMQTKGVYNLTAPSDPSKNKIKLRFGDAETEQKYLGKLKELETRVWTVISRWYPHDHIDRSKSTLYSDGLVLNPTSKKGESAFYNYRTGVPLKPEDVAFREVPYMVDCPQFTISILRIEERASDGRTTKEYVLTKKLAQAYCDIPPSSPVTKLAE